MVRFQAEFMQSLVNAVGEQTKTGSHECVGQCGAPWQNLVAVGIDLDQVSVSQSPIHF